MASAVLRKSGPSRVQPVALSAFAGCGGLDLGLESAGFRVVATIENDPTARATLRLNRPEMEAN